jgi:hypothetical protein
MLQRGNFAVVQRLVKIVLNPEHSDQFSRFLREIPTSSLLKLYSAAACDGFRQRSQHRYLPLLLVLEAALQERGALDAAGHIIGEPVDLLALA